MKGEASEEAKHRKVRAKSYLAEIALQYEPFRPLPPTDALFDTQRKRQKSLLYTQSHRVLDLKTCLWYSKLFKILDKKSVKVASLSLILSKIIKS